MSISQQPPAIDLRRILEVFILAVFIRFVYLAFLHYVYGPSIMEAEDSQAFIAAAERLADGQTLLGFDGLANFDGSLMPLSIVLMMLSGVKSGMLAGFIALQGVFDAASCVLIALTASRFAPEFFRPAGYVAALNPTQIVMAGLVLSDSIFFFFTTAVMLVLVDLALSTRRHPGIFLTAALLGSALAFALLTRAAILPWVPVALIIFVFLAWRQWGGARAVLGAILVVTFVGAAAAPILYRNYQKHDALLVTPQAGTHLLFWVVPLTANFGGVGSFDAAQSDAATRLESAISGADGTPGFLEREDAAKEVAVAMLREYGYMAVAKAWFVGAGLNIGLPATSIAPPVLGIPHGSFYGTAGDGAVQKVWNFVTDPQNRQYVTILAFSFGLTLIWLILVLVGMMHLLRRWPLATLILVLWTGYVLAVNGPIASPKYRLPIENVLVIGLAAGLVSRSHVFVRKRRF